MVCAVALRDAAPQTSREERPLAAKMQRGSCVDVMKEMKLTLTVIVSSLWTLCFLSRVSGYSVGTFVCLCLTDRLLLLFVRL